MKIEEVKSITTPHMEVVDKLWKIPMIESAWNTSYSIYGRVKASNDILNWSFSTAEGAVQKAMVHVTPVAIKFEQPIHVVDEKLCQGLNKIEETLPIVKQTPHEIYENARNYVSYSLQPAVKTAQEVKKINVKSLKDLSWAKANDILSSPCGHMALNGFDSTTGAAERYLDYYMPPANEEENQHTHLNTECDDKVMHAVHTVGVLSNKVSRRVYHAVNHRVSQINLQNINEYLMSLSLVVQLTHFLNAVNSRVESMPK